MDENEKINLTAEDTERSAAAGSDEAGGKSAGRRRKRLSIYDITAENDIKYRGPLSYRALKIIGWAAIIFSQYVMLMEFKESIVKTGGQIVFGPVVNSLIMSLALPTLLIGGFALLLNGHGKYKRLLMINGGAAAAFIIIYLALYQRYLLGFLAIFTGDKAYAATEVDRVLGELPGYHGFIAFNIFLDLFLCTLLLYFMTYRPKKYFQGKKIYIFRMFAIFPVLYEVASITLKILASTGKIMVIPAAAYPLLTTKPPMCFVMFFIMVMFIKNRERRFIKHGKTHEEYREFLKTNTNSFQFSLFMAVIVIISSLMDTLIFIVIVLVYMASSGIPLDSIDDAQITAVGRIVASWGIGGTAQMIVFVPILLLFSYTRTHKNPLIDTAIPVASVICIVFVYIESALDIIRSLYGKLQ